jgi:hypothetical protein
MAAAVRDALSMALGGELNHLIGIALLLGIQVRLSAATFRKPWQRVEMKLSVPSNARDPATPAPAQPL